MESEQASNNDDNKNVVLTYETLYEFLRREKSRDELQELPETFLLDLQEYLGEKKKDIDKANSTSTIFSACDKGKMLAQAENAVRIVRELYDRREKKIVNLAINKARTGSSIIDTSNLLDPEQELFDILQEDLSRFRTKVLQQVIEGSDIPLPKPEAEAPEMKADAEAPKEAKEEKQPEKAGQMRSVKFLRSIPKLVGKDLAEYGPFEEGSTATIPDDIAELLLKKAAVEEL